MIETLEERIKRHEGCCLVAYPDSLGYETIGFGHRIVSPEKYSDGISSDEALKILENDIAIVKKECAEYMPWILGLDDIRTSVIYEMVFQLGLAGVQCFRKMIAAIRDHDYSSAAKEMLDSTWHKQTPSRCEELATLMLNGEENAD